VDRGLEPVVSAPDAFARFLAEDRMRAARIVKDAGIAQQ